MGEAFGFLVGLACVGAWLTHVITCLMYGLWGFLVAGALLFPIGIIHGVMIWFGYGYGV
jgi:hypothetical protein